MNPAPFPEATKVLAAPPGQEKTCQPLHVWNGDGQQSISLWRPTWRERFSILFFGRVWLGVVFGPTQPPVWIDARRRMFTPAPNQK